LEEEKKQPPAIKTQRRRRRRVRRGRILLKKAEGEEPLKSGMEMSFGKRIHDFSK
jgi:hypothetical protein